MKHRLLLLDDHPAFRDGVAWFLRRDHYEVHAVGDGDEAATLLRRSHFDLVITDRDHPGMSADRIAQLSERCIVLTRSWREEGVHKCVPIAALLEHVKQILAN
jgi:DNA-binding response OmpR family regulator